MRKLILAATAFAGTAALATPAMAQDAGQPLGRFHVEAIAGYDNTKANFDVNGVVYGVGAGYDFHLGRSFSVGPDAEITTSSAEECQTVSGSLICAAPGRDIYVGGRLGLRFGREGRSMAYVGGGYTNARYDVAATVGNTVIDASDDIDGYRLKGGLELGLGERLFVRAEYRYSSYDDADTERHQVVGGVGLRF